MLLFGGSLQGNKSSYVISCILDSICQSIDISIIPYDNTYYISLLYSMKGGKYRYYLKCVRITASKCNK